MNQVPSYPNASLYVGNLHGDVTEAMLFERFGTVGPILSIRVCRDAATRRSLGYAYVNFQQPKDAQCALDTLNFNGIKGNAMRIMWSEHDPGRRRSGIGNIVISNLDPSINDRALFDTFTTFGQILSSRVAHDTEGRSTGYVQYKTQQAADLVIQKVNGKIIGDRQVKVCRFIPPQERIDYNLRNVFIKNFGEDFTDDQLYEAFAPYGTISSAMVKKDENGRGKGFGFVCYDSRETAAKAIQEMNGKLLNGQVIYAGRFQKKKERREEMRMYQERNLYVKNVDKSMSDEQFRKLFSKYGQIMSYKIERDEQGYSKGFGFVCFSSSEEAARAVAEMHDYRPRPLYVAPAQLKEERQAQLSAQYMALYMQNQVSQSEHSEEKHDQPVLGDGITQSQINTFPPRPISPQDQQMKQMQAQLAGLSFPTQTLQAQSQYPPLIMPCAQMGVPQQTSAHNQLPHQPPHGLRGQLLPYPILPWGLLPGLPFSQPGVLPPPRITPPGPPPGFSPLVTGPFPEEYCARIIYLVQQESTTLDIHFVVTSNMEMCIAALDRSYHLQYKGAAHFGPCQSIEFGSDVISLDISMDGIDNKGWKITPQVPPKVTKKQVDNFKPGMIPPRFQLMAEYKGNKQKVPSIRHCIKLTGAGEHFTDIIITLPPPVMSKPILPTPKRPSLKDLQTELLNTASDKWENIGISLGIDDRALIKIKSNPGNASDSGACLIAMLRNWLDRANPPPCWSAIADALQELGDEILADSLRSKYCMDCDSSS